MDSAAEKAAGVNETARAWSLPKTNTAAVDEAGDGGEAHVAL